MRKRLGEGDETERRPDDGGRDEEATWAVHETSNVYVYYALGLVC